ncbi:YaeC family lipoprotein [Frondihabitans sp. PhB188]|uniref:MetQ/NlpA family ABC transporter substrate-binding protein n=1 Tax=Frondihabitans sp. PhB188 TaxID=2485200 RepID=UPI000F49BA51|nr:MetQ/NlpA family ABC transporter substrate-binding protein [Frondihabitans sp. PhB188]ROQ41090.1 YaeC family lipoprotein [Frondihabitans sp. PhB188]
MSTEPTSTPDSHGFTLRKRRRWPFVVGGAVAVVAIAAGVTVPRLIPQASANDTKGATLYVVTAEGNAAEEALVDYVAKDVAPDYGITVKFKGLSDSTTLNRAVSDGEVAGTVYQHKRWLKQVLAANPDFKETAATPVFRWSFGLWSAKYKTASAIPDGATISLYSDPANEAQGLWILERAGLITLKAGIDKSTATQDDIASNPKHLKFTLLDFAAQSRSLNDLDAAVGYTEYYLAAGIPISEQIYAPAAPDAFAGQLTVGTDYLKSDNVKKLIKAFQDPRVQSFLESNADVKNILLPVDAK